MKYKVVVKFKEGITFTTVADKIYFHKYPGGIDIFEREDDTPVFPGLEENVEEIKISYLKPILIK